MDEGKLKDFYEKKYASGMEYQRTSKLLALKYIPHNGNLKILDIGCATGMNSKAIADRGHSVVGVDISVQAIKKYKDKGFNGLVANMEDMLPFPDETFDIVFSSDVIEHLTTPENLVKEAYRILRSNGKMILSTPNSSFWLYRLCALFGKTVSELQHPKHLIFFSRKSLRHLVEKNNFVTVIESGRNMYIILPDPKVSVLRAFYSLLGFREEKRYRTDSTFWQLSNHSNFLNSFLADTLILVASK